VFQIGESPGCPLLVLLVSFSRPCPAIRKCFGSLTLFTNALSNAATIHFAGTPLPLIPYYAKPHHKDRGMIYGFHANAFP